MLLRQRYQLCKWQNLLEQIVGKIGAQTHIRNLCELDASFTGVEAFPRPYRK